MNTQKIRLIFKKIKNRQTRALTVTFYILSIKQIKLYVLYDGEQQARNVRF